MIIGQSFRENFEILVDSMIKSDAVQIFKNFSQNKF